MTEESYSETPGICLNRIQFSINRVKFDQRFRVLHAEYETFEMRKKAVSLLFNEFKTVKSIRYEYGGKSFYVLLEGGSETSSIIDRLKQIVLDEPVKQEHYPDLDPDMVLELLGIGTSVPKTDDTDDPDELKTPLAFAEGSVFTFEEEDKDEEKGHIVTFNPKFRQAKDCQKLWGKVKMEVPAVSFSSVENVNSYDKGKEKLKELPRYIIDGDRLRCSFSDDISLSKMQYVRCGYPEMPRASIDYISMSGTADFDRSKMGRVRRYLNRIRKEYADIDLSIDFVRTDLFDGNKYYKSGTGFEKYLKTLYQETDGHPARKIYLKDNVHSVQSAAIIRGIKNDLSKKEFEVELEVVDDFVPDGFNLNLVQKKKRDPKHTVSGEYVVQNLSVQEYSKIYYRTSPEKLGELEKRQKEEEIDNGRKSSIVVMLSDMWIKHDVIHHTMTYFDWFQDRILNKEPIGSLDCTWKFYDRVRIKNDDPKHKMDAKYSDTMGCLELSMDGSMKCYLIEKEDIDTEDFHLMGIWSQFEENSGKIRGVLSDDVNTYVFLGTDVRMVPEIEKIRAKLKKNHDDKILDNTVGLTGGIRTVSEYEFYLKACTDIRYCYVGSECYYFVGVSGHGIDSVLHWSANLHRISRIEGDENIPTVMFDMMLVPFVRLNRFTISPYPFKYLREYEKMHDLEAYIPDDGEQEIPVEDKQVQWCLDSWC